MKSAAELAFVGDAVYELLVRAHIAANINTCPGNLHKRTVEYVCAEGQSEALTAITSSLTEDELGVVRRGKNATKTAVPKNGNPKEYRLATALEALFGYLYLSGQKTRLRELFCEICEYQEKAGAAKQEV